MFFLHLQESELYRCERDVRTRLGVAISEVLGSPLFHKKVGVSLCQEYNKRTCRLVLSVLFYVYEVEIGHLKSNRREESFHNSPSL